MATPFPAIYIENTRRPFPLGAVLGQTLIEMTSMEGNDQLLLQVANDTWVPIAANDIVFIHGEEAFTVGRGTSTEDNPLRLEPIECTINDRPLPSGPVGLRVKLTGAELKSLFGAHEDDLWLDLEGAPDTFVEDEARIILHRPHRFHAHHRDHEHRYYEVTVLLDGEPRERRFPAMMTVLEAIRRSLPPRDRPAADTFSMADKRLGNHSLPETASLKEAGVRSGDVLSISKKHGGGGDA